MPRIHNTRCLDRQKVFAERGVAVRFAHESVRASTKLKRIHQVTRIRLASVPHRVGMRVSNCVRRPTPLP
jgi:hypothetical protein